MEAQVKGVVKMMDYQVTNIQRACKDEFTFSCERKKKKKNDLNPVSASDLTLKALL